MPRLTPNSIRANAEAASIVDRLLNGNDTIHGIAKEYGTVYNVIWRILCERSSEAQRRAAHARKISQSKKGKRMGIRVSRRTEFKKGQMSAGARKRYKPIGAVVFRHCKEAGQKRPWIKVTDDAFPTWRKWERLATWVWTQSNGPVPKNHRIYHRDGLLGNCELSNLVCMTPGDWLFIKAEDPTIAARRDANARKARRQRAVYEKAVNAARKQRELAAA